MTYVINEVTPSFVAGRFSFDTISDIRKDVIAGISKTKLIDPEIGGHVDAAEDYSVRQGNIAWLDDCHTANETLKQLIDDLNADNWQRELDKEYPSLQFTMYADTGDHYDWHQDQYEDDEPFTRQLSISVCLSHIDEYQGAELFIKDGSEVNVRVFKMQYGDFVVFPSEIEHRVNQLREGERVTLVTWYGKTKSLQQVKIHQKKCGANYLTFFMSSSYIWMGELIYI